MQDKRQRKSAKAAHSPVAHPVANPEIEVYAAERAMRRPLWMVILSFLILGSLFWLSNAFFAAGVEMWMALPMRVEIRGLGNVAMPNVLRDKIEFDFPAKQSVKRPEGDVVVESLDVIQGAAVAIGNQPFTFSREEFLKSWQITTAFNQEKGQAFVHVVAPSQVSAPRSWLTQHRAAINWGGDWPFFKATFPGTLFCVLGGIMAFVLLLRIAPLGAVERCFLNGFANDAPPSSATAVVASWEKWLWPSIALAVFALAMVILEVNQPFHFTQDDGLATNMPYLLQGLRSVFSGVLPEWNPYQLMGIPSFSLGFSGLWYPPIYLSYAIARFLLGNEYLMLEVNSILHLFVGCLATYWAARKLGMRGSVAGVGSLCFVLSGYWLLIGRGWYNTIPAAVWTPLLVVSVIELGKKDVGWKWLVGSVAVIVTFFTLGFPQYWAYPMMCYVISIGVLALTRNVSIGNVLWAVAALLLSFSAIIPLVMMQMEWSSDLVRPDPYGLGIEWGLLAILFPHPLTHASFPGNLGLRDYSTQTYYSGTLFAALTFLGWGGLIAYRWNRAIIARNVWLFSAALMLLLSLGTAGFVWSLMSKLPIVSKVNNNPFRALAYFNLFAVLGGGLVFEYALRGLRNARKWEIATVLVVALLMLYHTSIARPALFAYGDKPYPALPKEVAELFDSTRPTDSHRVLGITQRKCPKPGLALAMAHGYPSVYSVLSYFGDDPSVQTKPLFTGDDPKLLGTKKPFRKGYSYMAVDPVAGAQAYGIRWLLVHKGVNEIIDIFQHPEKLKPEVQERMNPEEFFITHAVLLEKLYKNSRLVLDLPEVEIRELQGPCRPMAYAEDAPDTALPIHLSGWGATVDLDGKGAEEAVVVNFLAWPHLKATADGKAIDMGPDEWGRIRAVVPAGAKQLVVRYVPPWGKGLLYGALLALATGLGALAVNRLYFRRTTNPH